MAGEWIKVELTTPDKPEVLRMSRILGIDKDAVFGKLIRLWAWFDRNSVDGAVDGVVDGDVDALCYQTGFSAALVSVGWLHFDCNAERVSIPRFDRHNGESAKKRALKNEAQARWRLNRDGCVDVQQSTTASTREEKRREEVNTLEGFAEFWLAYPKKKNKGDAEKAWKKLKPDLAVCLTAIATAKESNSWKKDNGQFIPYPASWLNAKAWEDSDDAGGEDSFWRGVL